MSNHWGDLADEAAHKLLQEQLDEVNQISADIDSPKRVEGLEKKSLFARLEFKWTRDDKLILNRIRAACNAAALNHYQALIQTIDDFYAAIRVPVLNANGFPVTDEKGRVIWEKDESGNFKEDWSRLDGFDVDACIFKLHQNKVTLSSGTNELFQEALFAKHIYNDEHQDAYKSLLDGTQGDRNAYANLVSRESKYFAFYKFCVWQYCDTLLKEIKDLLRIMERIRDWRIRSVKY